MSNNKEVNYPQDCSGCPSNPSNYNANEFHFVDVEAAWRKLNNSDPTTWNYLMFREALLGTGNFQIDEKWIIDFNQKNSGLSPEERVIEASKIRVQDLILKEKENNGISSKQEWDNLEEEHY